MVAPGDQRLIGLHLEDSAPIPGQPERGREVGRHAARPGEDQQLILGEVVGSALEVARPARPGRGPASEPRRRLEGRATDRPLVGARRGVDLVDRTTVVVDQPQGVVARDVGGALPVLDRDGRSTNGEVRIVRSSCSDGLARAVPADARVPTSATVTQIARCLPQGRRRGREGPMARAAARTEPTYGMSPRCESSIWRTTSTESRERAIRVAAASSRSADRSGALVDRCACLTVRGPVPGIREAGLATELVDDPEEPLDVERLRDEVASSGVDQPGVLSRGHVGRDRPRPGGPRSSDRRSVARGAPGRSCPAG